MTTKNNTLERALKKCTKFYKNGVHVTCTPQEYVVLCAHFNVTPKNLQEHKQLIKNGISKPGIHYIQVNKWAQEFEVNKYAMLDVSMSNETC